MKYILYLLLLIPMAESRWYRVTILLPFQQKIFYIPENSFPNWILNYKNTQGLKELPPHSQVVKDITWLGVEYLVIVSLIAHTK